MKPISDRIFIKLNTQNPATSTSLILPDAELNHLSAHQGVVLSVGELVSTVKAGAGVLFHPFDDLKTPDPDVVVIREKSLLGILKN